MMAFEKKDNSGALFPNSNKKSENHPDLSGDIRIDGHDFWLSGWNNTSAKGPYIKISIKKKDGTSDRPAQPDKPVMDNTRHADLDDGIPF